MKKFNLLLRNAIRVMWKFKFLVLQLILLLLITITILSSVFLSNKSLEASYNDLKVTGGYPQFSVEDKQSKNNIEYNITSKDTKTPNAIIDENSNFELDKSEQIQNPDGTTSYKIYNPLISRELPTSSGVPLEVYGFVKTYEGFNTNPTPDPSLNVWMNTIYSQNYTFNIFLDVFSTDQKYKDRLYSLYTFYKNGLYDSKFNESFLAGDFSKLYDQSIYAFDPWSLRYNQDSISVSSTGIARLKDYDNNTSYQESNNGEVSLFNSIYDKNNQQIAGFDNAFNTSINQVDIDLVNHEVHLNEESQLNPTVNSTVIIPTKPEYLKDYNEFKKWAINRGWWIASENNNPLSNQYYNFNKAIFEELKTFTTTTNQEFIFNYSLNPTELSGLVEYCYKNPIPNFTPPNEQSNKFDTTGFFEGKIGIPVLPYLTVSYNDKDNKPSKAELINPIDLNDPNCKWVPDISKIKSQLFSSIEILKNDVITKLNNYLDYIKTNYSNQEFEKIPEWKNVKSWYDNYLKQYDIEKFLIDEKFVYSKTRNYNLQSLEESAIIAEYESNAQNNKIVLEAGRNILENNDIQIGLEVITNYQWVTEIYDLVEVEDQNPEIAKKQFTREEYLQKKIYNVYKVASEANYDLNPTDEDYIYRYTSWLGNPINTNNWPLYIKIVKEFESKWKIQKLTPTGYGYSINIRQTSDFDFVKIEQIGEYISTSSHAIILSQNYTNVKNGTKKPIDTEFFNQAIQLPARTYTPTNDDINKDPYKWEKHFIYNPYSNKKEFYVDFNDWLNRLPEDVLFSINNQNYVIIGVGLSPEFMYPILSANQFLINNNSPVIYVNTNGFEYIKQIQTVEINSNYWVSTNTKDFVSIKLDINTVNKKFINQYKTNIAYDIENSHQPNKLLYTRMNFSRNIMHIVFTLTITIGIIIALLSLAFLVILLRSIIKQNLNSFAIGLSNGISKIELALSFFPMAIIPSFIASLIGYVISLFVYPLINSTIASYWVLTINPIVFSFLVFASLFLISSLLTFVTIICIVFHTLRKPTAELLTQAEEFKINKLMQLTKPMFRKMDSLASFRGSFIFKNFGRFITLTGLMTLFMTFASMFVSLDSSFDNAIKHTLKNKDYNFSLDLYSPTMSNGYYSTFSPNEIGGAHDGYTPEVGQVYSPLYTGWTGPRPSNISPEQINYLPYLTFHDPLVDQNNKSKDIVYTNFSLPSINLVSDLTNNINFFKNKIWIRNFLDIDIDFLGIKINPWAWAKKAIPESILSIVDKRFNEQINDALAYFYYQFKNQNTLEKVDNLDNIYRKGYFDKSVYSWYIKNDDPNRTLVTDIHDSKDPSTWNQNGWFFKLKKENGKWLWKTDINDINFGLPTYTIKPDFIKLVVNIISLPSNGLYKKYWEITHPNEPIINRNSFMGLNVVAFDKTKNQLYTYLDATKVKDNKSIKIKGIDPKINLNTSKEYETTPKFYLYNQYDNNRNLVEDLKQWDLNNFEGNSLKENHDDFPLIINEVVAKKYKYKIGDKIKLIINNTYDRFENRFYNKVEKPIIFKVIGITTSKSEEQYFTTQKVANNLLRFVEPTVKPAKEIFETNDFNSWPAENLNGKKPFEVYTPFNGIISNEEIPMNINNILNFYSPSGINFLVATIPSTYYNDNSSIQIANNWSKINQVMGFKFIENDSIQSPSMFDILNSFSKKYYETFQTINYYTNATNLVSATFADQMIGNVMDKTIGDIITIVIVSFIPTLIIIILLLSFVIIQEARRIIALLKVLGFSDWTNAVSLSFMYYLILLLSLLLNIGLNYLLSYLFSMLAFNLFSIIISPVAPWWIYIATFGALLLALIGLTSSIFYKLKKSILTEEINVR